jgi:predicted MFS family arabinose efflux permease
MEQTPERERGAVNSVMQLMWEVGWTVGPYLSGVVQARYGFAPLFISTATLYGIAIGLTCCPLFCYNHPHPFIRCEAIR